MKIGLIDVALQVADALDACGLLYVRRSAEVLGVADLLDRALQAVKAPE